MPKYAVGKTKFWDGTKILPPGTVINIEPEDYKTLLSLSFIPMDEQAKKDLAAAREKLTYVDKAGRKIAYALPPEEKYGDLNPNDPKDMAQLTPRGVQVVAQ